MPVAELKAFLEENGVKYDSIKHAKAFTAMDVAQTAHVRGKEIAKTVMVKMDGHLAMAVLPATRMLDVDLLRIAAGARSVELAKEPDFQGDFPGCEVGAMPPFGNLYHMDVYVEPHLSADPEIAFNAGSHTELVRMSYKDFARLVHPKVLPIASA